MIPSSFTSVARVEIRHHRIQRRVVVSAVRSRSDRGGGVKARRTGAKVRRTVSQRERGRWRKAWACGSVADGVLDRAMRAGKCS